MSRNNDSFPHLADHEDQASMHGSNRGVAEVDVMPSYVIEWSTQLRRLKFLPTVDELRAELTPGDHRLEGSVKRLFIVHGLPADYIALLQHSLAIDPLFIDAHAGRRRYSPLHRRPDNRFVHFEYPELVSLVDGKDHDRGSPQICPAPAGDLMGDPPHYPLSGGNDAVVLCRGSLWLTRTNDDVLFLDRPAWSGPTARLQKARQSAPVSTSLREALGGNGAEGEEIPSLEDVLQVALKDPGQVAGGLMNLLSELVYDHWLKFFESPMMDPESNSAHVMSLSWKVQLSLEQNLNITRYLSRHIAELPITAAEWQGLLDRNGRRVDLATLAAGGAKAIAEEFRALQEAQRTGKEPKTLKAGEKDEHSRSLDRVSYMGGILLPVTLVSAILSMSDPFSPTGHLFYVFWLISIPATLLTLLIIYADTIRKAKVWVEIAAESAEVEEAAAHVKTEEYGKTTPGAVSSYDMGSHDIVEEGIEEFPMLILERPADGGRAKAWRRQELGWSGAVKRVVGYNPRPEGNIPQGIPYHERDGRGRRRRL